MAWTAPVVTRVDEPFVASERAMLEGWLGWHRTTLLFKCEGVLPASNCHSRPFRLRT
jgi:hypothetical protein